MAKRALELVITRNGHQEGTQAVVDDPGDTAAMRRYLVDWLAAAGWHEGRWGEFELTAFAAGTWKKLAKGIRV